MSRDLVDAVITWVDGCDKAHAEKRAQQLGKMGAVSPESIAPTRFNQCGELSYCVRSIVRFAPWVRTIYIVTDAQIPPILEEFAGTALEEKIKLVDHQEIFQGFESYLPTFNSLSIESMLWRIKGLSDKFIYFNDDVLILRPVLYEDFFKDNKMVLRGRWKVMSKKKWLFRVSNIINSIFKKNKALEELNIYQRVQENTARLVGWTSHYFHLLHAPLPALRHVFDDFSKAHSEIILENIRYPFRDDHQFLPLLLAENLEIDRKQVVFDNRLQAIYVNGACYSLGKIKRRLSRADRKKQAAFMCIQSMDLASESARQLLFDWLDKRIGEGGQGG